MRRVSAERRREAGCFAGRKGLRRRLDDADEKRLKSGPLAQEMMEPQGHTQVLTRRGKVLHRIWA
ncbi:MAG: hypothetical protein AB1700_17975, partial [Bacillota bacterium]